MLRCQPYTMRPRHQLRTRVPKYTRNASTSRNRAISTGRPPRATTLPRAAPRSRRRRRAPRCSRAKLSQVAVEFVAVAASPAHNVWSTSVKRSGGTRGRRAVHPTCPKSGCQPGTEFLRKPLDVSFEVILGEHFLTCRSPESPSLLRIFHETLHRFGNRAWVCRRNE
jgi:hypothetical protein